MEQPTETCANPSGDMDMDDDEAHLREFIEKYQRLVSKHPGLEAVANHAAFPGTIWNLEPRQSGLLPVARGRGGPINISWEVHGDGKIKVVFIIGLGGIKTFWQRQTLHFGHVHGDKYSVLLIDNRGMGDSDKPFFMRYTTLEMAKDLLEVLDYVGWTHSLQLHVVGHSLGGMIAQELALLAPERVCSLSLLSTAARVENTATFSENLASRMDMLRPRGLEGDIALTARLLFSPAWLLADDDADLPSARTPRCPRVRGTPGYARFATNYQRFVAEELLKKTDSTKFTKKGFMKQLMAANGHRKTDAQLRKLAEDIGRDRICVLHGLDDQMIAAPLGERLIRILQPGVGLLVEGMGHAPFIEQARAFNELMEQRFAVGEKLNCS